MSKFVLAIDQGTSGTKALLFDEKGKIVAKDKLSHEQFSPRPGWVEHDPEEIYENTVKVSRKVVEKSGVEERDISNLAITNQRESIVVWDPETGEPAHNVVVWQDQRGKEICKEFKDQGYERTIRDKTGLVIDPYFSASKLSWLLQHEEGMRESTRKGNLLMGTIDSWLIWKLTNGEVHATDYSNASRTMLFNIHELEWDRELLDLFSVPRSVCPEVKSSDAVFGMAKEENLFYRPIPISGVMGDSHAALFGQTCFNPGDTKATYGTGSSVMMNIGERTPDSPPGLVTSIGWGLKDEISYVLEGNIHSAGDVIQWLIEGLELLSTTAQVEQLAREAEGNSDLYLVPAFVGLGAPYWDNDARGLVIGLTRGVEKGHLVRAALESIAYQIKDLISVMAEQKGARLEEIRVDGGMTANDFLMQFQSDLLGAPVVRSGIEEVSALGVAYMGGLKRGLWSNQEELRGFKEFDERFEPKMTRDERNQRYSGWQDAVEKSLSDESHSIRKIVLPDQD